MTEDKQSIPIEDVLTRVNTRVNRLEEDIAEDLSAITEVVVDNKDYFICRNKFWDLWFRKLFALLISVKIWIMALITILLACGLITNLQFASILGGVVAIKGGFDIADVWKREGSSDIIDKV